MMELNLSQLNSSAWNERHIQLPGFDIDVVRKYTKNNPKWVHFGCGNIFRAFPAAVLQELLNQGAEDVGLIVAEGFDEEIIEKIYRPHDNLSLLVTLKADGSIEKKVIGSVAEALLMNKKSVADAERLREIFRSPSLQMASFTITEKGYKLQDAEGSYFPVVQHDFAAGPKDAESYIGKITALCYERFLAGKMPIALVSMDNFSHNGDRLRDAVWDFAEKWEKNGTAEQGFLSWIQDPQKVSFPWTMIDKITPRPSLAIMHMLEEEGLRDMSVIVTQKQTYIAPFVNAEECEYLVMEDHFPAGRPCLEKGGIYFADKNTVDKTEKMKVCTCLNPLHTALAIFGCLLSYTKISDEMQDPLLKEMVYQLGYREGMPVVTDPGIIEPKKFLKEVLEERIPNPFMPDTPQRIATDTSQKLPIRFGETIKAYIRNESMNVQDLTVVPLVLAGWLRYLMAVDDNGVPFELSPDPLHEDLKKYFAHISLGKTDGCEQELAPILSNARIFGVDLCEAGLAERIVGYFREMASKKGAVRKTLEKYVIGNK